MSGGRKVKEKEKRRGETVKGKEARETVKEEKDKDGGKR